MTGPARTFAFRFDPAFRPLLGLLGVRPETAWVRVDADEVRVRFGPWRLRTRRSNVAGVERGGPYRWWRVIGPHLSMADAGVSFGSSTAAGLCVRFVEPVPALLPGRWVRHPGVTLTVVDPDDLGRALTGPSAG
ncbi:hypothetical protein [Micromonospora endolithica]|uniref:Uncharacterized protein n=1 Tax=Micromonospora endolithica TaxID=230091 RepID=A0A3A9YXN8_9ACTN|nr:hypothetical protein [Micromonospora endolithica]RKN40579.1 hypothetical protein D7223_25920 [Micromonospora endolithica]TWJ21660.1 hypothetical protein JD76_01770 [Micromonospora endolithica]